MIYLPALPSANEGGLSIVNSRLLTIHFGDDRPSQARTGRFFQHDPFLDENDGYTGDFGNRSSFWYPGRLLKQSEFGPDGPEFVRGKDPMGLREPWLL